MDRTRRIGETMQTSLWGIAEKAANQKGHRFGNLYERLNEEILHECWGKINKNAAYGVEKISAREYERNLEENIKVSSQNLRARNPFF
jgi:hypothetical protein